MIGDAVLNEQVSVVRPRRDSSRQQLADLTVGWIPTTPTLFGLVTIRPGPALESNITRPEQVFRC